ncbi:hypothetical protein MKX03_004477, partial [Papaver bracteatum]
GLSSAIHSRDTAANLTNMTLMKAPCIEELEEQMQKLDVDRAIAALERKASDNADEMMEIETHSSAE